MNQGINKALGLPDNYNASFNDAVKVIERFKESMHGKERPITNISFIYYNDKFGDLLKPKTHISAIVNDMFKNLDMDSQFMLLNYFNEE